MEEINYENIIVDIIRETCYKFPKFQLKEVDELQDISIYHEIISVLNINEFTYFSEECSDKINTQYFVMRLYESGLLYKSSKIKAMHLTNDKFRFAYSYYKIWYLKKLANKYNNDEEMNNHIKVGIADHKYYIKLLKEKIKLI